MTRANLDASAMVLDDLTQRYFEATSAEDGLELLDKYRQSSDYEGLAWLLRHHDDETIDEQETWDRDAIDDLLDYYSILEVALIAGLVKELPASVAGLAAENLGDLVMRIYYEDHYPLTLPSLLRLRLRGAHAVVDTTADDAFVWFARFLSINQLVENDDEVDDFLWMIDGGTVSDDDDDYDIDDLLEILRDADEFSDRLQKKRRHRTRVDGALHGFRTFVAFALQLDELLRASRHRRLLAASFWHYHAYWFTHFESFFGRRVPKALERMVQWDIQDARVQGALKRDVRLAQSAFENLASGEYGRALNRWLSY